jgi:glycosyltransferase involved in cell wall biosynthesis
LVTQHRNREAILRAGLPEQAFTTINSEALAAPVFKFASAVRGGADKGWTTVAAITVLSYPYFEWLVWKNFANRLRHGEFDLVHRITPLSPTVPSLLAPKLAKCGVPFILGPLNGGTPWPAGFNDVRQKEKEWFSYLRGAHKLLPGYESTRKHSAAIIVGSRAAFDEVPQRYRHKCVYVPENAIDPSRFEISVDRPIKAPLRIAFVGRLVPYKGADMLLEAAAPLVREGKVTVDIIGDGPEMPRLRALIAQAEIGSGVQLDGWVEHSRLQYRLVQSDVFAFPSVREFGGAVVLEAMALGLVPVVVGYGGPAELVTESTGYVAPMGRRPEIISRVRQILAGLVADPSGLREMGRRARSRVFQQFTWEAKARQVFEVYRWVLGERPDKPDFGMPFPDPPFANDAVSSELEATS